MPIPWMAFAVAVTMNCVWGGNPVAVKLGLEAFPPFWTAFLRFCLGIACVGLWARMVGIRLFPSPEEWKPYLGLSIMFGVQIWIMNVGYGLTTGVMGSVLISVYPLVAALLGPWAVAGDRLDAVRALGLLAAFIGTATVLLGETETGELELFSTGNWLVLLSGTLLGIRLVMTTRVIRVSDPARATFWQMVLAQPWFLAGALSSETIVWHAIGWRPVAGIVFQGVIIAGLGFMVIAYLLRRYRPSTMISLGFVTPVSGAALSAWILGETVTQSFVVGLIEVAIGLALVLREPHEPASSGKPHPPPSDPPPSGPARPAGRISARGRPP